MPLEDGVDYPLPECISGMPGIQGDRGLRGYKGDKGDPGQKGDQGVEGEDGLHGKSAYDIAVLQGYVGTEVQWIASLQGDASSALKGYFSFGSVSSILIAGIVPGTTVTKVNIIILEEFDGVGATVTIGIDDDHDLLTKAIDIDLTTVGTYEISPGYKFADNENIKIYSNSGSGASTGIGEVTVLI